MRGQILVTPRSLTQLGLENVAELQPLRDAGFELIATPAGTLPSADDLRAVPASVVGWIAGVEEIHDDVLAHFPGLIGISRNGIGADNIDMAAASARGVDVALAIGANARGVAELALAHILNGLRRVSWANASLHDGQWTRSMGTEMPQVVLGIVGLGSIGRLVAQFATALGARVVAYDPFAHADAAPQVELVSLDDLFGACSVVSLHSPPPEDGSALVGRAQLDLLATGSVLVNTARSALVDADAVLDALESGQLSSYAVDAFDEEPPTLTPLLQHPNTVLTPHLGGYTTASTVRATEQAVANLLTVLEARM